MSKTAYRKAYREASHEERKAIFRARYRRNQERKKVSYQKRKDAKSSAPSEAYTIKEIAERDRNKCGICGFLVNVRLPGVDPMGPTIDHIVPLSAGGSDLRHNVQLAHHRCNSAKGNRRAKSQLRLPIAHKGGRS